jgi:hypothetical protein
MAGKVVSAEGRRPDLSRRCFQTNVRAAGLGVGFLNRSFDIPVLSLYCVCMPIVQDAKKILHDAETALREHIEQCLAEKRYAEVAEIAALAEGVARLIHEHPRQTVTVLRPALPLTAVPLSGSAPPTRKAGKKVYPSFLRDGGRLVKIGWSKKAKTEYEHRTPREVPDLLLVAIRSKVTEGELFAATDVIPLSVGAGADNVPDYQAYLALKWLHSEGVISKNGRDRYALEPGKLGPAGLNEFWQRLPAYKGAKHGGSK